jgi:hypothetical protein
MSRTGLFTTRRPRGAPLEDLHDDLHALRQHTAQLADQISDLLSAKGNETIAQMRKQVQRAGKLGGSTALDLAGRARGTVEAARDTTEEVLDRMGVAIQKHPLAVIAASLGLFLVLAMAWRR